MLLQEAFYSGTRGVLKVLDHMLEEGEADEAQRTIRRFGRHVEVIMRRSPRRRRTEVVAARGAEEFALTVIGDIEADMVTERSPR